MVLFGVFSAVVALWATGDGRLHPKPSPSFVVHKHENTPQGGARPLGASLDDIEDGRVLYQRKCGACRSLDRNRVGPRHRGVYGRKSASVEDFRYSEALRALDVVWDEETLDAWLASPTDMAPGTSMGFRLSDPDERKSVIAYLKSVSAD